MLRLLASCGIAILALGAVARAQGAAILTAQRSQGGEILREIDDAANGCRWLLERNAAHPGGPGRMVLAGRCVPEQRNHAATPLLPVPVIRAGDRVVLEAHTATMDAQLEAVALAPAVVGSDFAVRLKIGGRVTRAVAVARGRAMWLEGPVTEDGAEQ